jgi:hypothetical protein
VTEPTPEPIPEPDTRLQDSLIAFTGCVGEAVADICSYGLTIGEAYVPFDPDPEDDCDEDEALCSQMWVRVTGVQPVAVTDSFGGDCGGTLRVDLEVGVLRCLEIEEGGEAPKASDVLVAATQAMADMQAIHCAAMSCEVWDAIESGAWSPSGPLGGQYGGMWTFSVEL